ncbi:TetR/AcrR family transcriptional regulator [Paraconexibacter sp.]|uniref:TetR/AcrR family transcriptional regulator n=1 Tax=Paraconexibacter sp. TaxID=2949640 RepID=UPI003564E653
MASTPKETSSKRAAVQASVLLATESLLEEGSSFADLGIERIATRAGISRTAFYFYFKDKKDLLKQLTEEISAQLYEQADIWFSGAGDPVEEMRTALQRIGEIYRAHGPLLRAIVEASTYEPEVAEFWRTLLGRFVDAAADRMDRAQAEGAPPIATRPAAFALAWMTERTFYEQLVQDEPFVLEELVEGLTEIWVRAVHGARPDA